MTAQAILMLFEKVKILEETIAKQDAKIKHLEDLIAKQERDVQKILDQQNFQKIIDQQKQDADIILDFDFDSEHESRHEREFIDVSDVKLKKTQNVRRSGSIDFMSVFD